MLIYCRLSYEGSIETVFLLSGNDHRIHLFRAEVRDIVVLTACNAMRCVRGFRHVVWLVHSRKSNVILVKFGENIGLCQIGMFFFSF